MQWARRVKEDGFFIEPDALVQTSYREIADYVNDKYVSYEASKFLDDADPWIIAHAKAYGRKVVTFEVSAPNSKEPKIPDVGSGFDIKWQNTFEMVRELGMSLTLIE